MVKAAIAATAALLLLPAIIASVAATNSAHTSGPAHVDGIPGVLLEAYLRAAATLEGIHPQCTGMRWQILAGIGEVESDLLAGRDIAANGDVTPPVIGPRLDGSGVGGNTTPHHDTDNGRFDGDTAYDRAVGPGQHLPTSWVAYGADGNGDGTADPHNVFDSALATARQLCLSAGRAVDFTDRAHLDAALFRYNRSRTYVTDVLAAIDRFDTLPASAGALGGGGSEAGRAAARWALAQVGKPYLWGGTGPAAFDCSGLTQQAWTAAGVRIPRVTTDQVRIGTPVSLDQLQPGDLLFYDTGSGPSPSHVTMYIGDGQMVNAPSTGQHVRVEPVQSTYYSPRLTQARRPG